MARQTLFKVLLVVAFAAVAAAQSCPSKTCRTGGAGNVDCCQYNWASSDRCSWPGTPVSFRVQGKCEQDGKTYAVLNESNSQGPPDQSNPCRCPSPSVGGTTKPVAPAPAPAKPTIISGADIPGYDIPSPSGQPFTRICTPTSGGYKGKYGYEAYALMCRDTPGCAAATTERSSSGCAYMKRSGAKGQLVASKDWVVITSQVAPAPPCRYANLGEACTTQPYPFVAQPVCCGGNKNPCVNGVCESGYPPSPSSGR